MNIRQKARFWGEMCEVEGVSSEIRPKIDLWEKMWEVTAVSGEYETESQVTGKKI